MIFGSYYGISKLYSPVSKVVDFYLKIFITSRNGIFVGLVYVSLGSIICDKYENIKFNKLHVVGLIVSFIGFVLETIILDKYGLSNGHNANIFLLLFTYFFFLTIINIKIDNNKIFIYLRKLSTLIFIFHMFFVYILRIFINNNLSIFIFDIVLTVILSFIIIYMQKFDKFKWLNYLT